MTWQESILHNALQQMILLDTYHVPPHHRDQTGKGSGKGNGKGSQDKDKDRIRIKTMQDKTRTDIGLYVHRFCSMLSYSYALIKGPTGLHGQFLQRNIDAVTLEPRKSTLHKEQEDAQGDLQIHRHKESL